MRRLSMLLLLACCPLVGCSLNTGSEVVEVPVMVTGTAMTPFETSDGWTVELTRADVAVGPLYVCAAEMAGDLCETARGEMLEGVVIDAMDPTSHEAGLLVAAEGTVRSVMHDYGIFWELTDTQPRTTEGADALGGHSVVFEGTARKGEAEVPFVAEVDALPNREGVVVVRRGMEAHEVRHGDVLTIAVDPTSWLEGVRFDALAEKSVGGAPVRFEPEEQSWRAVTIGMTAGIRPELRWETN